MSTHFSIEGGIAPNDSDAHINSAAIMSGRKALSQRPVVTQHRSAVMIFQRRKKTGDVGSELRQGSSFLFRVLRHRGKVFQRDRDVTVQFMPEAEDGCPVIPNRCAIIA